MAQVFTKQDFYLLAYMLRWWREKESEDEEEEGWKRDRREGWGLGEVNTVGDRERLIDLAKRILAIVRSYPKEEEESDNEPEASEEGDASSVENESVLGEQ